MEKDSRLILAIDVYEAERALRVAEQAEGRIRAIKVNWPLVMANGISIIGKLSRYADILCDFKVADIPNTNRMITEKARENGAWGIISHIFPGKDSIRAVKDAAGDMKVVGVVAMSHPGYADFMAKQMDALLSTAKENGLYGIIAPGNNYGILRDLSSRSGSLRIIAPGVGAQGGSASDAVKNGADYIIVGRRIVQAADPAAAIDQINGEIGKAIELKY